MNGEIVCQAPKAEKRGLELKVIKQYSREREQNSDHQRKGLSFSLASGGWALLMCTIESRGPWQAIVLRTSGFPQLVRTSQSSHQRGWACDECKAKVSPTLSWDSLPAWGSRHIAGGRPLPLLQEVSQVHWESRGQHSHFSDMNGWVLKTGYPGNNNTYGQFVLSALG